MNKICMILILVWFLPGYNWEQEIKMFRTEEKKLIFIFPTRVTNHNYQRLLLLLSRT